MNELKAVMCSLDLEEVSLVLESKNSQGSQNNKLNDSKTSVVTLSDMTIIDGKPWSSLKV